MYSLQGVCPGLTHEQKIGVSYYKPQYETHETGSVNKRPASPKTNVVVITPDANPPDLVNNGSLEESNKTETGNPSPKTDAVLISSDANPTYLVNNESLEESEKPEKGNLTFEQ